MQKLRFQKKEFQQYYFKIENEENIIQKHHYYNLRRGKHDIRNNVKLQKNVFRQRSEKVYEKCFGCIWDGRMRNRKDN